MQGTYWVLHFLDMGTPILIFALNCYFKVKLKSFELEGIVCK